MAPSLLLLIALTAAAVVAAVTITGFVVEAGEEEIFVDWETASETDNLGFYVWRSLSETADYVKLPLDAPPAQQVIPSDDEFGVGAFYEFIDVQVTPGIRYYYKVSDIPAGGSSGEIVGPKSAIIPLPSPATDTSTPTATPTATPTPTGNATPLPTAPAAVLFWADPESVNADDCSTVQWQAQNVQAVFLDGTGVAGQGAQTFCPCGPESHVLRVKYRDGRTEDFTVTIGITGTCSSGTGSSPLATPAASATAKPTNTPEPATDTPAPTPTRSLRATATPSESQLRISPLQTMTPSEPEVILPKEDAATSPLPSPLAVTPATRIPQVSGAVEADGASVLPRWSMWLLLAAALGVGMVAGGIWLWKRG